MVVVDGLNEDGMVWDGKEEQRDDGQSTSRIVEWKWKIAPEIRRVDFRSPVGGCDWLDSLSPSCALHVTGAW